MSPAGALAGAVVAAAAAGAAVGATPGVGAMVAGAAGRVGWLVGLPAGGAPVVATGAVDDVLDGEPQAASKAVVPIASEPRLARIRNCRRLWKWLSMRGPPPYSRTLRP